MVSDDTDQEDVFAISTVDNVDLRVTEILKAE